MGKLIFFKKRNPGYVQPTPIEDPWEYIDLYRIATENARKAGFDGVELHAANGYLPHQFLESHSNLRDDEWGGTIEKRCKFILEAVKTMQKAFGNPKRVGIKLSPGGGLNDMGDSLDVAMEEYSFLLKELDTLNMAYIQISRFLGDPMKRGNGIDVMKLRPCIQNTLFFLNNSLTASECELLLEKKKIDGAFFGRHFISNPDLPRRLLNDLPLNALDPESFYFYEERRKGYTDYPFFSSSF